MRLLTKDIRNRWEIGDRYAIRCEAIGGLITDDRHQILDLLAGWNLLNYE
ncbi:hypothetical protein [Sphingobacterium kyonggiense]